MLDHSDLGVITGLEAKQSVPSVLHNFFYQICILAIIYLEEDAIIHTIQLYVVIDFLLFLSTVFFPQLQHNFKSDDYDYSV